MKVNFKTLIPNPVKNWIIEKGYEEPLVEAEKRLGWKLNNVEAFKLNGMISGVEYDEHKQMVGNCSIMINADSDDQARKEFNKVFVDVAKRGQKFKIESFIQQN